MSMTRLIGPWLPRAALSLLAAAFVPGAGAGDRFNPVPPATALGWLSRINTAANEQSYRGTMVFTADGVVSSSRVAHLCTGDQFVERVESLDGRQHRVYRHNQIVHTVWPQDKVVVVERRDTATGLVTTRRTVEPRALEHYALGEGGERRIAGRTARVLLLQPLDNLRYAQRLWADVETGLLLRTDVLGPDARVLESSAFGEIEIGLQIKPVALLQGMSPPGYRIVESPNAVVDLEAEGWHQRRAIPGFRLMGCLKRPMAGEDAAQMLQAVFSDGLTYVSVFVEPFDARRHTEALAAVMGATGTVMQREGAYWITAMGDVPRLTLDHFVRALERRP